MPGQRRYNLEAVNVSQGNRKEKGSGCEQWKGRDGGTRLLHLLHSFLLLQQMKLGFY